MQLTEMEVSNDVRNMDAGPVGGGVGVGLDTGAGGARVVALVVVCAIFVAGLVIGWALSALIQ